MKTYDPEKVEALLALASKGVYGKREGGALVALAKVVRSSAREVSEASEKEINELLWEVSRRLGAGEIVVEDFAGYTREAVRAALARFAPPAPREEEPAP